MFLAQRNGTETIMNSKRNIVAIVFLAIFICSGCNNPFKRYVHIHDRYPVYSVPEKTNLPQISNEKLSSLDDETKNQIVTAVKDLKSEAAQLRAILDSYNDFAKQKNAEYDQLFVK